MSEGNDYDLTPARRYRDWSRKILFGVISIWPLASLLSYFLWPAKEALVLAVAFWLPSVAFVATACLGIAYHPRIRGGNKLLWILGLIFTGGLALPLHWIAHFLLDDEAKLAALLEDQRDLLGPGAPDPGSNAPLPSGTGVGGEGPAPTHE